jgi:hypothetical protein
MGKFQQHAVFERKIAWVGGEFGEQYARKKFGDAIVDALPVKKRGKYKGRFNASIEWIKITRPGWVPTNYRVFQDEPAPGYVETRKDSVVAVILYSDTSYGGFVIHGIEGDTRHFANELRSANQNKLHAA